MTRVQADIVPAFQDWLEGQDLGSAVKVRANVPANWKPTDGQLLIVADDGGNTLWPVKSQHTVRLTAYAGGRTEARRIVSLAVAKLVESKPRPVGVAHIDPDMGAVLDARDKATGAVLASVLLTAHTRTVEV